MVKVMEKNLLIQQVKNFALKHGDFTLSSGKKSKYYLDLKQAYTRPEVMQEIISLLKASVKDIEFDRIAGMELGAVPIAVLLSMSTDKPFVIIRKERKDYGAAKRIEGHIGKGDNVLLVEDVVTTGGSVVSAAEAIRQEGGVCTRAVAVVDRLNGARENLQKINIHLMSLVTIKDLGF